MRVHVMSGDMKQDLGFGMLLNEDGVINVLEVIEKDGSRSLLSSSNGAEIEDVELENLRSAHPELTIERRKIENNPMILLDNGDVIFGAQCWWNRVEEDGNVR